uniref:Uncharacterized protein n=1 Tax=Arundo donax TaxID=35708 RepID=A0A0A9GC28_ARUDO
MNATSKPKLQQHPKQATATYATHLIYCNKQNYLMKQIKWYSATIFETSAIAQMTFKILVFTTQKNTCRNNYAHEKHPPQQSLPFAYILKPAIRRRFHHNIICYLAKEQVRGGKHSVLWTYDVEHQRNKRVTLDNLPKPNTISSHIFTFCLLILICNTRQRRRESNLKTV